MLDTFRTFRLAARALARRPLFAAAAIAVLALGVGANTTLVALLRALLFAPLPGVLGEGLVWISSAWQDRARLSGLAPADLADLEQLTPELFAGVMGYAPAELGITAAAGEPLLVRGQVASAAYFEVLGVAPQRGRFFLAGEDRGAGAHPVLVLSDRLWRQHFGADPAILGRSLLVNGASLTVVGIAPPRFHGPELGAAAEAWIPLSMVHLARPSEPDALGARSGSWMRVMARLAPGTEPGLAKVALRTLDTRLAAELPDLFAGRSFALRPAMGGLAPENASDLSPVTALVSAVAGILLLIACSNVSSLLTARTLGRSRELAVRAALGAERWHLISELLAESLLLALAAGLAGLLAAVWAADLLLALLPAADFDGLVIVLDGWLLTSAVSLAAAAALLSGLAPALAATGRRRLGVRTRLALAPPQRSRLERFLVASQLALSLALLAAAGAGLAAIGRAGTIPLGFDARGVATLRFDLPLQGYDGPARRAFERRLVEEVLTLPGVEAASLANIAPLSGMVYRGWVASASAADPDQEGTFAAFNGVSPGYFRSLGIPLLAGRDFGWEEAAGTPGVAILNHTAALALFGEESPLGRRLRLGGAGGDLVEVVGITADTKHDEATEEAQALLYRPLAQAPLLGATELFAKGPGEAAALVPTLSRLLAGLDRGLPIARATTLEALIADRINKERAISRLVSAFGLLGLALAAVGLYGLMSQLVSRRQREMGVRIALGASARELCGLALADGLRLARSGIAAGTLLGAPLVMLLAKTLGGLAASDLLAFAAAITLLTATTLAAAYLPARRALAIEPQVVLREE